MPACETCARPLPEDFYASRRRYCPESSTCRVKAHRARVDLRRDLAFELLLRQTKAIQDGDLAALTAIAREAERLLPAT